MNGPRSLPVSGCVKNRENEPLVRDRDKGGMGPGP